MNRLFIDLSFKTQYPQEFRSSYVPIPMGTCLGVPQRDCSFYSHMSVVSTGPAAERQDKCLSV
jgi:hypothetical protein